MERIDDAGHSSKPPFLIPARDVELVLDSRDAIGEGPTWDAAGNRLLWVDILAAKVHAYEPATDHFVNLDTPSQVGFVVPRHGGGLLLGLEDGWWVTATGSLQARRLAEVESTDRSTRMNVGKCDRAGRAWGGTVAHDGRPWAGSLYRLDVDGSLCRVAGDISISSGITWSPDDRTMYFIDSASCGVDAFDYDISTGFASNRRRSFAIDPEDGSPVGMTIDTQGALWVALYDGFEVRRYWPDGGLSQVIKLPVSKVTSCAFGGKDLRDLYITSARSGLSAADLSYEPYAGGLFRCRPGFAGLPEAAFAG